MESISQSQSEVIPDRPLLDPQDLEQDEFIMRDFDFNA